jgi:hypothetical protein
MLGHLAQGLAFPDHLGRVAHLMGRQLWLSAEPDAALSGGSHPAARASQDASAFVFGDLTIAPLTSRSVPPEVHLPRA